MVILSSKLIIQMKSLIIVIQIGTVDTCCPQSSQIGHISGTNLNELSFSRVTDAAAVIHAVIRV